MADIRIKTVNKVVPVIYAYTTPQIAKHDGWVKIGYSEQPVKNRIGQQTHTADIEYKLEWALNATFDDGSGEVFHDSDFHAYLKKNGIKRNPGTEWFQISPLRAKQLLTEFRENRGVLQKSNTVIPYTLRTEQAQAVGATVSYFTSHEEPEFLWNAKPRFGKTLSVYDLVKQMHLTKVLIVTNRPAIANSWYDDYAKFLGLESGYAFVSEVSALKDKPLDLSRDAYVQQATSPNGKQNYIEFISLQDLKGSIAFGGHFDKLIEVSELVWDLLVIDEAHEGVDTRKTDIAFDHIKRKYTLHLSGTPFKALADEKFPEEAIFNWTYADEQEKKRSWNDADGENPYGKLPRLNMYTYQMSSIVEDELRKGVQIGDETDDWAFDLNEFFLTDGKGRFVHNESVNKFLDALATQEKFPFSTDELRNELKHTLWLLNRVDSAKALEKKLKDHPVFKNYKIILAAGDGKTDDDTENKKAFDRVTEAISKYDKTITLSVGQLTTGVTIPEWTAVLMLSNMKSPALYMQAAFRSQNPCLFNVNGSYMRKTECYVFDFDPARTLIIYEKFANDLSSDTSAGKGDSDTRREHVRKLLNFFPVIAEDDHGKMIELDAEKVLSIPRKIKCQEVVRRGFMSNFLFQNIGNIFNAPPEVIDIINTMEPVKEPQTPSGNVPMDTNTGSDLDINDDGEVDVPEEKIIGTAPDVFGDKRYEDIADGLKDAIDNATPTEPSEIDKKLAELQEKFHTDVTEPLINQAANHYGKDLSSSTQKTIKRKINSETDTALNKTFGDYKIKDNLIEREHDKKLNEVKTDEERAQADKEYKDKKKENDAALKENLATLKDTLIKKAGNTVIKAGETERRERTKRTIEDNVRDHLRGFSRTIPSFLMAYGKGNNITLATFHQIVPDKVFVEVTSITLDQFKFLRDGGDFTDAEGKTQHFKGNLFDPVVFDDSVKEFMNLRIRLADYFNEAHKEDIFDYIPPQKTNQIFTPKKVVERMVDQLEAENPGCFDDPNQTFADLYMKSGMYITEIVKRLYNSNKLKQLFPDNAKRLNHIFAKQIYGLAPTEIIYQICLSYILGFSDQITINKNNIRLCDALKYAQEGTLEQKLIELFPELKDKT